MTTNLERIEQWNREWTSLFKRVRLNWLYTMPPHVIDFFDQSHIVGAIHQEKEAVLLLQYGDAYYRLRKFTVALYHASVYFISDAEEVHIAQFFSLPYEEQHIVTAYLDQFPFEESCQSLHEAGVAIQEQQLASQLIGKQIHHVFFQDGHFVAVLENGQTLLIP